jgi:hypothetical protein
MGTERRMNDCSCAPNLIYPLVCPTWAHGTYVPGRTTRFLPRYTLGYTSALRLSKPSSARLPSTHLVCDERQQSGETIFNWDDSRRRTIAAAYRFGTLVRFRGDHRPEP